MHRFRLFRVRSPLLTESMALSFPVLTEMFHFGTSGPLTCARVPGFSSRGVSPFGHPRIEACLAATRGISQLAASFFASRSQGIHHPPLVACPHILENQYGTEPNPKRWFTFLSLDHGPTSSRSDSSRFSQSPRIRTDDADPGSELPMFRRGTIKPVALCLQIPSTADCSAPLGVSAIHPRQAEL